MVQIANIVREMTVYMKSTNPTAYYPFPMTTVQEMLNGKCDQLHLTDTDSPCTLADVEKLLQVSNLNIRVVMHC